MNKLYWIWKIWKKLCFFSLNERVLKQNKKWHFLLNKLFFRTVSKKISFVTEWTVSLNNQLYWTKDFTEWSFWEKKNKIWWKINNNFENERNQFFERMKKTTKMKRKKSNVPISSFKCILATLRQSSSFFSWHFGQALQFLNNSYQTVWF